MTAKLRHVTAIVFDWAGTTVDHGSLAPAIAFKELFRGRRVDITAAQAREPMGMAKRDHIGAILAMPAVASAWRAAHGRPHDEADIDALYEDFLPLQERVLQEHSDVIAGVPEAVEACRRMGLKIGSTTGYSRALMEIVSASAKRQGYEPDCVVCADDVLRGRPAPYLLYEAAMRLNVYPLWTVVAVDDTPLGIEAGLHAGCWTVGVTRTGNCLGLSPEEVEALPGDERLRLCDQADQRLRSVGARYTIESTAEIVPILLDIDRRLGAGESPI
ncbi:MAG TPA: phosphonoacetaldehyde hydrolase [Pirellulales bacterium]|jgi:phosphonoacetaldehyde hydrolase|nr:phosphonoacetaldehyde hydrolase [Pirellulales bacterium]